MRVGFERLVLEKAILVRVHRVFAAHVDFAVDVEAPGVGDLDVEAVDQARRGQTVVEEDAGLVRVVLDVAVRPGHFQQGRLQQFDVVARHRQAGQQVDAAGLAIGPDLDSVVVGDHQVEGYVDDLGGSGTGVVDVVEVIVDDDHLVAVSRQGAAALDAASDGWPGRRIGSHVAGAALAADAVGVFGGDDDVVDEQGGAAGAVFGTVVGEHQRDAGQRQGSLVGTQRADERVALESLDQGA